jgi:hypothetical protein
LQSGTFLQVIPRTTSGVITDGLLVHGQLW